MKKIFLAVFAVLFGVIGMSSVDAITIKDDGNYVIIFNTVEGDINGEDAKYVKFDFDEGEDKALLSDLTKGIEPFNKGKKFTGWGKNIFGEIISDEIPKADFNSSGEFDGVSYTNGYYVWAQFSDDVMKGTGTYYITIDAIGGTVSSKKSIRLTYKASEFKTLDLSKYKAVRDGFTFIGWGSDEKNEVVSSIDSSFFKDGDAVNLRALYKSNTFDDTTNVLNLNANGGMIDGKAIGKYNYIGGATSGDDMAIYNYVPVRNGYTFTGWNSKKDGSGTNYSYVYWRMWDKNSSNDLERDTLLDGTFYKNLVLYATWKSNSGKVKEVVSSSKTDGSITFSKEVSDSYVLDIKPIKIDKKFANKDVKFLADINILNNNQVVKISNTKMKIRIALPKELKGYNKYEVVYILNGEIKETIPAKVENGYIVFTTTHLSEYGIVAKNVNVENPNTNDSILISFVTLFICVIGIGSCFILNKRFN